MYKNKYLIIIMILLFIFIIFLNSQINYNNFDFYVISIHNPDRIANIELQKNHNNLDIKIFDGVIGELINMDELILTNKLTIEYKKDTKQRKREIGCYLSHINLYAYIKNDMNKKKYTVIFEDDFYIDSTNNNFINYINKIINDISTESFDIIYLSNLYLNHGLLLKNNVYYPNELIDLLCTHAYIINNDHIDKFITQEFLLIDMPIDNKINKLIKEHKLKAFTIYPSIIHQIGQSTITEHF